MSKRAVWASVDTNPGEANSRIARLTHHWCHCIAKSISRGLAKAGTADPYDQDDRERNERRR